LIENARIDWLKKFALTRMIKAFYNVVNQKLLQVRFDSDEDYLNGFENGRNIAMSKNFIWIRF